MRRWLSRSVFVVLAACLILGIAAPASLAAPASPAGALYHIVQRGENLYRIGLRYGISLWSIAQANGILNVNLIQTGQVLLIPVPLPAPMPVPRIYIVRPGDTLAGIAWRFGTTVWVIARANGVWNPNLIYVGQRLLIP
jgi:LysM repeat protein